MANKFSPLLKHDTGVREDIHGATCRMASGYMVGGRLSGRNNNLKYM